MIDTQIIKKALIKSNSPRSAVETHAAEFKATPHNYFMKGKGIEMNTPDYRTYKDVKINPDLSGAMTDLRAVTGNTMDLNIMFVKVSGVDCAVATIEAMTSTSAMSELIFRPLMNLELHKKSNAEGVFSFLTEESLLAAERKIVFTYGDVIQYLFSGFAVIFVESLSKAVVYSIQGYDKRSVSTPESEQTIKAAQDSFTETIRTNLSLIRRRMKTPSLRFEMMQIGKRSSTDVCMMYMCDRASSETVDALRKQLSKIKLDTVLTTGYIEPFIDESFGSSVFSQMSYSERPDMICTRLNQGRICILVDGTPFCIICPALFAENFQTMDDYCEKPYYVTFMRWLKYIAFFLAVAFPGLYVALANFHPEVFTLKLLLNLAVSEEATPYPLTAEVFMLMVLFEIMKEAGLRLPKSVGSAVSIVGGLIIGDAAVKSGLISAPLLIVVGITATSSFVIPSLNQQTTILRLVYILVGGCSGLYGIAVCTLLLIANINAMDDFAISYTAPVTPFFPKGITDVISRKSFKSYERTESTMKEYREKRGEKS